MACRQTAHRATACCKVRRLQIDISLAGQIAGHLLMAGGCASVTNQINPLPILLLLPFTAGISICSDKELE